MKRIGQSGKLKMARILILRIHAERMEEGILFEIREIVRPATWSVQFEFIQETGGHEGRSLTVEMWGRYDGNDERMREEMLLSKQITAFGTSSEAHLWNESDSSIRTRIEDPHKIIPWLFPKMDVAEFFNTTTQQANDKPLRLPASSSE